MGILPYFHIQVIQFSLHPGGIRQEITNLEILGFEHKTAD
jgi:hypothetical protein